MMVKLYTMVGHVGFEQNRGLLLPYMNVDGEMKYLDIHEELIWRSLSRRVLDEGEIQASYVKLAVTAHVCMDTPTGEVAGYLERMEQRGMVIAGEGANRQDATYDLIAQRYVVPIRWSFWNKVSSSLTLLRRGYPRSYVKDTIWPSFQHDASAILCLIRQQKLSVAEIIALIDQDVRTVRDGQQIVDAIYSDGTASDRNIHIYSKYAACKGQVLEALLEQYRHSCLYFEVTN